MNQEVIVYWANLGCLIEHGTEEHTLEYIFAAESHDHAITSAALALRNRCNAFDWEPGYLQVGVMAINPIANDGSYKTNKGPWFFEWKVGKLGVAFQDILYSYSTRMALAR